jgi:hypothetical protein
MATKSHQKAQKIIALAVAVLPDSSSVFVLSGDFLWRKTPNPFHEKYPRPRLVPVVRRRIPVRR